MGDQQVHAFRDDALGEDDAVSIARRVAAGEVSAAEVAAAAAARARSVDPVLHATAFTAFEAPRVAATGSGPLFGVPVFVKDNTDVRGMPSGHGSEAFVARRCRADGAYTRQLLSTGVTVLGKSRLPEFGFNASTEFMTAEPTRNPWHLEHSVGASSGGSAALVAAGVVPIAHANDGGGSIRIPAACAGLVGFKPSRHRHVDGELARHLPLKIISEGVLTRTVRDTAAYLAAAEDYWRSPSLPPLGIVEGPARRSLRVGLVLDSITGAETDGPTRAAVEAAAELLAGAGHSVEPLALPVTRRFADDFLQYWGLLAALAASTGRLSFDRSFDATRLDGLTRGLSARHRRTWSRTPGALHRLRRASRAYAGMFARHDLVLSPVLAHTTPRLGWLSPAVPFDELIERLLHYVAFTPLHNVAGAPAVSLPLGRTSDGLPIGVQLGAAYGDDRTLLEAAFLLEELHPFPRLRDGTGVRPDPR